jgi:hypothetical protein
MTVIIHNSASGILDSIIHTFSAALNSHCLPANLEPLVPLRRIYFFLCYTQCDLHFLHQRLTVSIRSLEVLK